MIYGRSVVGGYGKFMKLRPMKGLLNIYIATVGAFVSGSQEAVKRMKKVGGGAIVTLSSTGNLVYIDNYAGHGTNKAAVEAMSRYASTELGEFNIRVNAVSGGPNRDRCTKSIYKLSKEGKERRQSKRLRT